MNSNSLRWQIYAMGVVVAFVAMLYTVDAAGPYEAVEASRSTEGVELPHEEPGLLGSSQQVPPMPADLLGFATDFSGVSLPVPMWTAGDPQRGASPGVHLVTLRYGELRLVRKAPEGSHVLLKRWVFNHPQGKDVIEFSGIDPIALTVAFRAADARGMRLWVFPVIPVAPAAGTQP